jgi:hypothetical protein
VQTLRQRGKKVKSELNPYIDEIPASFANGSLAAFRQASLNPNIDAIEDAKAASATDNYQEFEHDLEDIVEGDGEFELERDARNDDFSSHDPLRDRQGEGRGRDQQQQQRRIGKLKRKEAPEPTREELNSFLTGLDSTFDNLQELVEETDTDKEFENWNNWFKPKKKAPPAPDSAKVFYIREEFNTRRSPHMWKSNPDRQWILTYGHTKINNVVSANLYKYQNDTISKDA